MVQASAMEDIFVADDLPQALVLLKEMKEHVQKVTQLVDNMLLRVKSGEISTSRGLSFLEVKYQMLLSYLINVTCVILHKCSGQKIEGDPAIDRLVEIRTVLEKIRPLDQKLKYQVDKLVKTTATGMVPEEDPLRFRANPENLISKLEIKDSDDDSDSDGEKKSKGTYVPPKLAAVHYDGDVTEAERQHQRLERARKRALSSSIMQDLKEEYLDTPTEIYDMTDTYSARISREAKERKEYEEAYLKRVPLSKKERHRLRQLSTLGSLGEELTRFGDVAALAEDDDEAGPSSGGGGGGKKSKLAHKVQAKGKGKKRGFRKKRN